jgi:hypothetical protein
VLRTATWQFIGQPFLHLLERDAARLGEEQQDRGSHERQGAAAKAMDQGEAADTRFVLVARIRALGRSSIKVLNHMNFVQFV